MLCRCHAVAQKKKPWRHYTDAKGYEEFLKSGMLKTSPNGVVYVTDQMMTYDEVQARLFIGLEKDLGKGLFMVEFEARDGVTFVPGKNDLEFYHVGNLRVGRHIDVQYQGRNVLATKYVGPPLPPIPKGKKE